MIRWRDGAYGGHGGYVDDGNDAAPLTCDDCDLLYEEFPLDVVLSDDDWRLIHPERSGGVLCARCIVKRAASITGVTVVRASLER